MDGTAYVFRFFHPAFGPSRQTLDCFAADHQAAIRSARRFIARENRLLKRAGHKPITTPGANSVRPRGV